MWKFKERSLQNSQFFYILIIDSRIEIPIKEYSIKICVEHLRGTSYLQTEFQLRKHGNSKKNLVFLVSIILSST